MGQDERVAQPDGPALIPRAAESTDARPAEPAIPGKREAEVEWSGAVGWWAPPDAPLLPEA